MLHFIKNSTCAVFPWADLNIHFNPISNSHSPLKLLNLLINAARASFLIRQQHRSHSVWNCLCYQLLSRLRHTTVYKTFMITFFIVIFYGEGNQRHKAADYFNSTNWKVNNQSTVQNAIFLSCNWFFPRLKRLNWSMYEVLITFQKKEELASSFWCKWFIVHEKFTLFCVHSKLKRKHDKCIIFSLSFQFPFRSSHFQFFILFSSSRKMIE